MLLFFSQIDKKTPRLGVQIRDVLKIFGLIYADNFSLCF